MEYYKGMDRHSKTRGISPDRPRLKSFGLTPGEPDAVLSDQDKVRHNASVRFTELVGELRKLGWTSAKIGRVTSAAGFTGGGADITVALAKLEGVVAAAKRGEIPVSEVRGVKPPGQ